MMTLTGLKILARIMSIVVRVGVEGSVLTSPASTRCFTCSDVKPSVANLKLGVGGKPVVDGKSGVDGKLCKPDADVELPGDVEPSATDGLDLSSITKVSL